MISKLLIASLIIFFVFLIIYLMVRKAKGTLSKFSKLSGLISIAGLIFTIIFGTIYIKDNNTKIFSKVKKYDLQKTYTELLTKKGPEKAYDLLPVEAFSINDEAYFINSKSDVFTVIGSEEGYKPETSLSEVAFLDSSKTLKATITTNGDLILDGYLFYSTYENAKIEYKNKKIAENVEFCNFTNNSLFYINKKGELYALGFNAYGQLGDTTTKNKAKPTLVKSDILKASVSDTHALIVDKFGTLYAVGDNTYSQLGNNNAVSSTELIKIMQGVKDVRAGNNYSMVLTVNGELYMAGNNEYGQLGNNGEQYKAKLIQTLSGVEEIDINGNTCAALNHSGELYVWGDNTDFKAGTDKPEKILTPFKVSDNVYDFTLSDSGVVIITNDRDIVLSNDAGALETAISFGAQIPDIYKERFPNNIAITDEKV